MSALLLLNKGSVSGCKAFAENSALAKASLALSCLDTKVVTVVVVRHLYLAASGKRKSLGRCLMCLDLSHFNSPFSRVSPIINNQLFFVGLDGRKYDRHKASLKHRLFLGYTGLAAGFLKLCYNLTAKLHV